VAIVVALLSPLVALSPIAWKAGRYWYWRHDAQRRVDTEIARLEAAGEPLTARDLHAAHRVPDGARDLTKQWLQVLTQLDSVRPDPSSAEFEALPVIGAGSLEELEPAAAEQCLVAAEQYLRRIAPQVEALLALSSEEGEIRFPVAFEKHLAALLPHVEQLRFAANVLSVRARVCAIQGDTEELDRSLLALAVLPETLDESRTMVEQLMRCVLSRLCCEAMLDAANRGQLSAEKLQQFAERLAQSDFKRSASLAYTGERVQSWEAMDENASFVAGDDGGFYSWIDEAGPVDRAFLLDAMAKAIKASQYDYVSASQEFDALKDQMEQKMSLPGLERLHYLYSVLLLPSTYEGYVAFFIQDARRRVTQTALSAHAFQLRTGRWPQNVAELIRSYGDPAFIDPFNGEPLRIREEQSNLVIYSVGRDLTDDGGEEINGRFEPDIVAVAKLTSSPDNGGEGRVDP
jgi:hypothetical protein